MNGPAPATLATAGGSSATLERSTEHGATVQAKLSSWFLQYWYQLKQAVPMLSNIGSPVVPDDGPAYLFSTLFSAHILESEFAARFALVPWMTYRKDFVPIEGYQSDCGWGCMLRSAQMMLAETLFRTECALGSSVASKATREKVLRLFADRPDRPYSIHEMSRRAARYGKRAGEWFEPTLTLLIVCEMLRDDTRSKLRAIVARDGLLDASSLVPKQRQDRASSKDFDPLINPHTDSPLPTSTLILVPLRLGLRELNEESYGRALIEALRFPQSVGMIGGKPAHSLYFCGSQASRKLIFLDPHIVQSASQCADLSTYQCPSARAMLLKDVDPSLALGFLVSSYEDFLDLKRRVEALPGPAMFSISTEPVDFSTTLGDDDDEMGDGGGSGRGNDDDDDEFEQVKVPNSPLALGGHSTHTQSLASADLNEEPALVGMEGQDEESEEEEETFTEVSKTVTPPPPPPPPQPNEQKKDTFVFL